MREFLPLPAEKCALPRILSYRRIRRHTVRPLKAAMEAREFIRVSLQIKSQVEIDGVSGILQRVNWKNLKKATGTRWPENHFVNSGYLPSDNEERYSFTRP